MNFAMQFIIGQRLALTQGVTAQQAARDGLVGAALKSPLGLALAIMMARSQVVSTPRRRPRVTP